MKINISYRSILDSTLCHHKYCNNYEVYPYIRESFEPTLYTTPKPPPPILFDGWKCPVADLKALWENNFTLLVAISDHTEAT